MEKYGDIAIAPMMETKLEKWKMTSKLGVYRIVRVWEITWG